MTCYEDCGHLSPQIVPTGSTVHHLVTETATVDPTGKRNKTFGSIIIFVISALPICECTMVFLIIIGTNWQSIDCWHYAF